MGQILTRGSQAHWVTVDPLNPALLTFGAALCSVGCSAVSLAQALDASRNPGASTAMSLSVCVCVCVCVLSLEVASDAL